MPKYLPPTRPKRGYKRLTGKLPLLLTLRQQRDKRHFPRLAYIDAAVSEQVNAQMATEGIQAQIEAATAEQLASDEVQQQISASVETALGENEAYQGIVALKG